MHLIFYSSAGWQAWDVSRKPAIRQAMPVLIDDDLRFEDAAGPRATTVVNRWLRELPVNGAPSANSWEVYARVLKGWLVFLTAQDIPVFGSRQQLRAGLSMYAGHRLAGPLDMRVSESTWNLYVVVLAQFYDWAVEEGHATAVPFTYTMAKRLVEDRLVEVRSNLAKVRAPRPHTTIKYLVRDFSDLFVRALEGLLPDGSPDPAFRGLNPGRNAAMAKLVLSSGLRRQEFTHLLVHELPPLPSAPSPLPIPLHVPSAITKGRKARTTWVSYDALAAVHRYIALDRRLATDGSAWRPADPLVVTDPDWRGARINGTRVAWAMLGRRAAAAGRRGRGSCLLGVQVGGEPFLDWPTVFRRAGDDIRNRFEPRIPHVKPHRLRHSFALFTLEQLVAGYYRQAAKLVADTDDNAAMALYLTSSDPLLVLRDLLGHVSVTTTEIYLSRLDMTRVFRDAYSHSAPGDVVSGDVLAEVDAEFEDTEELGVS
ncbi:MULTISPECIES: tyrosine-type recombinase/integrase [Saccharothrix]|uniref:tyrosine-type recombinase/integrase n=1 Tax=Saccharothrix TaxID=2071 RepID=UPI0009394891|nr:integrase [Saccharothrix sp. CB00851]OKI28567.1 integrase [Saccharothrix sp. CB00851]